MSMLPKLYAGVIQSGLRCLGRVGRRSRKQLGVCISQPPLRVASRLERTMQRQRERARVRRDVWAIIAALSSMVYFKGKYCGGELLWNRSGTALQPLWKRSGTALQPLRHRTNTKPTFSSMAFAFQHGSRRKSLLVIVFVGNRNRKLCFLQL